MIHSYTVFGNPVAQSLSPKIHRLFAEQSQRRLEYTTSLSTAADFGDDVRQFRDNGGHGCNVTVPFKELAAELCDNHDDAARVAGACNTIKFQGDGELSGYNTDGSGFLYDLKKNLRFDPKDKSILILGAGGSTRGVLQPLLHENPARVVVVNRTAERAEKLVSHFSGIGPLEACSFQQLTEDAAAFDLVVNATSTSLQGELPDVPATVFGSTTLAYDFAYSKETQKRDTVFTQHALEQGCARATDGLGMLLEQAADAFFIWQDVRPKTRMISHKVLA